VAAYLTSIAPHAALRPPGEMRPPACLAPALPVPQPSRTAGLSVGTTEDGKESVGEHEQHIAEISQRERPVVAGLADRIDTKRRKSAGSLSVRIVIV
jgi:hypothetical protein